MKDYYTQLTIDIADVPSEALSHFTYKPTRFDGTVGDVYATFRSSGTTYCYEGVSLGDALSVVKVVAEVLDGDDTASVGFEFTYTIKASYLGVEVTAVAA